MELRKHEARECVVCGTSIFIKRQDTRCCSNACSSKNWRTKRKEEQLKNCKVRKCASCGTNISIKQQSAKYCSKVCSDKKYREAHRARITAYQKKYRKERATEIAACKKEYYKKHATEIATHKKEYYEENKTTITATHRKYYEKNKTVITAYKKQYHVKNRLKILANQKKYRIENKNRKANYLREKRKTDLLFKTIGNMSSRVRGFLKQRGYKKRSSIKQIIGGTPEFVLNYLKTQFEETHDIPFESHTDLELHHITPLKTAKSIADVEQLSHYTNLVYLTKAEHIEIHRRCI